MLSESANRICREGLALRKTFAKFDYHWFIVRSEVLRMLKDRKGLRRNDVVYCRNLRRSPSVRHHDPKSGSYSDSSQFLVDMRIVPSLCAHKE